MVTSSFMASFIYFLNKKDSYKQKVEEKFEKVNPFKKLDKEKAKKGLNYKFQFRRSVSLLLLDKQ